MARGHDALRVDGVDDGRAQELGEVHHFVSRANRATPDGDQGAPSLTQQRGRAADGLGGRRGRVWQRPRGRLDRAGF